MKTLKNIVAILLLGLLFINTGCTKKETEVQDEITLPNLKVESSFVMSFPMFHNTATETDGSAIYTGSDTTFRDNPSFIKFGDRVKDIRIKKMFIQINTFQGSANAMLSGSIQYSPSVEILIPEANIMANYTAGQKINIPDHNNAFEYIGDQLFLEPELIFSFTFRFSDVPVNGNFTVYYIAEFTVSPF